LVDAALLRRLGNTATGDFVPTRYWEDFVAGDVATFGPRLVTRDEIVAFAAEFDPQPMHLDEDAARATMLGGLSASGWHTCCLLMRMISDGFLCDSTFMGGPGVDEVRWLGPVRPGERVIVRATVLEARPSTSRPHLGFTKILFEMFNAAEQRLMTMTPNMMFVRRQSARPG
jgi:acyl dehydratase